MSLSVVPEVSLFESVTSFVWHFFYGMVNVWPSSRHVVRLCNTSYSPLLRTQRCVFWLHRSLEPLLGLLFLWICTKMLPFWRVCHYSFAVHAGTTTVSIHAFTCLEGTFLMPPFQYFFCSFSDSQQKIRFDRLCFSFNSLCCGSHFVFVQHWGSSCTKFLFCEVKWSGRVYNNFFQTMCWDGSTV